MRILFDGRVFQFQKAGGINRYFAEIITGLPAEWQPVVTGAHDYGENVPRHRNLTTLNPPRFRPGRFQEPYYRKWWRPKIARSVNLLHPTYYDLTSGFKLADFSCPMVATVYDMIYARFPRQTEGEFIIKAQRESVLRADRVVCISKSTERDLLEFIPEAAGKTTVIYLGSSFPSSNDVEDPKLFEKPRFIFVGGRGGYKNFLFLLRAFAKAASVVNTIQLHVVGPEFNTEERWQMYYMGITDKVSSTVYPNESVLQDLYRRSVALLYPSRYEGFGIPPLEAMSCGTIPVTANTTSLPEVVGDGGIMLDPTDEDAWADCIIKLATPFPERDKMLSLARERVKQFTWTECVRRHLAIYKELA
jgi:glycosyltransferase involved in cell wall biosynthesis